jgi:hypothetical protein
MKVEHHSDNEMILTSCHDNCTDGKVEENSHKEEEEDPLLIQLPEIKFEYEVRTYPVLGTFQ